MSFTSTIIQNQIIECLGQVKDGFHVVIADDEEFSGTYAFTKEFDAASAPSAIFAGDVSPLPRAANVGAQFQPRGAWFCGCGTVHNFSAYAAAHWMDRLAHECQCGARRDFKKGRVHKLTVPRGGST